MCQIAAKLRHTCWMGPGAEASKAPVPGRAGGGGGVPADMLALGVPCPNFCARDTGRGTKRWLELDKDDADPRSDM